MCPARAHDSASFLSTFVSALHVIAEGAPHSRMFVVSQFGSPGTYAVSLSLADRRKFAMDAGYGTGPCDFINPAGRIVPKKVARLDNVITATRRNSRPAASASRSAATTAAQPAASSTSAGTSHPT